MESDFSINNIMTVIPKVGCFPSLERDQIWLDIRYVGGGKLKEYAVKIEIRHLSNNKVAYNKKIRFEYILPDASFVVPLAGFPDADLLLNGKKIFAKSFVFDIDELDPEALRKERWKKLNSFVTKEG